MPVENQANKVLLNGTGSQTEFQFSFKIFKKENIDVFTVADTGVQTKKTLDIDYSVASEDFNLGGIVTLNVAPLATEKVLIIRNIPLEQNADFRPVSGFPEEVITDSFDTSRMIDQDLQEQVARCVKTRSSIDLEDKELPVGEEGKALIWGPGGKSIINATRTNEGIVEDATAQADRAEAQAIIAADKAGIATSQAEIATAQAAISTSKAQEAVDAVTGFDTHVAEKQNDFDVNAATLTARYDNNDLEKTNAFNQNAQDMTDGFNTNVMLKIDDFDAHAMEKEIAFDDNAAAKQALVDDSAALAKGSELNAKTSEDNAQIWAEGTDREVGGLGGEHSSKGWAELASAIVGQGVIDDGTTSTATTYSSSKIEAELEKKKNKTITILKNPINDGYYLEGNENANTIYNYVYGDKTSVELAFDDIITNTGEQIYPFETFDKDRNAIFRRNIITKDKVERINIKVNYQGTVTFESIPFEGGTGAGHMVGELVAFPVSTKYTPEGFIKPDGTEFTEGLFPDLWKFYLHPITIGEEQVTILDVCTYKEYANEVNTYGACAKWAVDDVRKTFKVPFMPAGYYLKNGDGTANKAGLPNITGYVLANFCTFDIYEGAFKNRSRAGRALGGQGQSNVAVDIELDASQSNPIYGASDTVETNAVAVQWFIYVANAQIGQSAIDWSRFETAVASKPNREEVPHLAMPSDRYIDLSFGASGSEYTVPADGYIILDTTATSATSGVRLVNLTKEYSSSSQYTNNTGITNSVFILVQKNDKVLLQYINIQLIHFRFIYAEGGI